MITIYGIKNCDSVKKAVSFFKNNNIPYEIFDFKTEKLSCDTISRWLTKIDMKTLFNARSTTYRNLKLGELNLNEEEQEKWLCKENLLIKRPVIEYKDEVIVGFKEEIYTRIFK